MKISPVDLLEIDRFIERDHARIRQFRRALRDDPRSELPVLSRHSSRLAQRDLLLELEGDPIAADLAQHVAALTLIRVTLADEAEVFRQASERHDGDRETAICVREVVPRLLDPNEQRGQILRELGAIGHGTQAACRQWLLRRAEAARLLGAGSALEIENPRRDPKSLVPTVDELLSMADRLSEQPPPGREDLPLAALARDAGEGFPSVLGTPWLRQLFGGSLLVDGLSLPPLALPPARGAASFVRALVTFGEQLVWQDRSAGVPFALSRDAGHALARERGVLFGALLLDPVFLRRKLGLGRERAADQARTMGRASLLWQRSLCEKVLLGEGFARELPPARLVEVGDQCFGRGLTPSLMGVLPLIDPSAPSWLWALEPAFAERRALRERFDEDWFDNPKAHEALRHGHHVPPKPAAEPVPALESFLREILG